MGDYYEELLEGLKPLPGTVSWLLEQGKLGREEILYQQEYTWDPLTGMRERSVRCICTACGRPGITEKRMWAPAAPMDMHRRPSAS